MLIKLLLNIFIKINYIDGINILFFNNFLPPNSYYNKYDDDLLNKALKTDNVKLMKYLVHVYSFYINDDYFFCKILYNNSENIMRYLIYNHLLDMKLLLFNIDYYQEVKYMIFILVDEFNINVDKIRNPTVRYFLKNSSEFKNDIRMFKLNKIIK